MKIKGILCLGLYVGEKDGEEKDLNSEALSLSEATSEKEANGVSQRGTKKNEERSNSIKKVGSTSH